MSDRIRTWRVLGVVEVTLSATSMQEARRIASKRFGMDVRHVEEERFKEEVGTAPQSRS